MTIKKVSGGEIVVSHTGKRLTKPKSHEGAVKDLRRIEYFKNHPDSKAVVNPDLIKDGRLYSPVVFQTRGNVGKNDIEGEKIDFPSTGKAYDLEASVPRDFPSTAETGQPIAAAFGSPSENERSWNGPDTQHKGSDYPKKSTRKSLMIAGRRVKLIKGSEGSDNGNLGGYPIDAAEEAEKRKAFIRAEALKEKMKERETGRSVLNIASSPEGYLGRSKDSELNKGNKDAATNPKPDQSKRFLGDAEHMEQHGKPGDEKKFYDRNSSDVAGQKKQLSMFKRHMTKKGDVPTLEKLSSDTSSLHEYGRKSKDSDKIGEYTVESPDRTKVYKRAYIDPNKPHTVSLIHYSPEAIAKREERAKRKVTIKSKFGKVILQYTQNQPLAATLKPLVGYLVTDEKEEEHVKKDEYDTDTHEAWHGARGSIIWKPKQKDVTPLVSIEERRRKRKPMKNPWHSNVSQGSAVRDFNERNANKAMSSEEVHEKIRRTTKKEGGPRIKPIKKPDLGPDGLPEENLSHDPGFDSWANKFNANKSEGVEKGEVIDFAAAKARKQANEKSGVEKIPLENVDWSNVRPAPSKGTSEGHASQIGSTTVTTPNYKRNAPPARTKAYEYDKKKDDVVVSEEEPGKSEFKVTKRIPANAGREEELKNASSRSNPIDGGIGDDLDYKDVDQQELQAGIDVEQEHVGKDPNLDDDEKKVKAADIAMDHLKEDDTYYTKLAEMERSSKQEAKSETQKKKLLRLSKDDNGSWHCRAISKALLREERDPSSKAYKKLQREEKVKDRTPKPYEQREKIYND